jgi:hypothetical protein
MIRWMRRLLVLSIALSSAPAFAQPRGVEFDVNLAEHEAIVIGYKVYVVVGTNRVRWLDVGKPAADLSGHVQYLDSTIFDGLTAGTYEVFVVAYNQGGESLDSPHDSFIVFEPAAVDQVEPERIPAVPDTQATDPIPTEPVTTEPASSGAIGSEPIATDPVPAEPAAPAPLPAEPLVSPSPDGTRLPPSTEIVDASLAVWTIDADGRILRNGESAGRGWGSTITWCGGAIRIFGFDRQWWEWDQSGFVPIGTTDPCTAVDGEPPPDGI